MPTAFLSLQNIQARVGERYIISRKTACLYPNTNIDSNEDWFRQVPLYLQTKTYIVNFQNKIDRHDITEILLKVSLKPIFIGINVCVWVQTGLPCMQVNLTKIYNIGTLFKVRFIQDSGLFSCRFRQMSLCLVSIIVETGRRINDFLINDFTMMLRILPAVLHDYLSFY
jgi:hypothetical protein